MLQHTKMDTQGMSGPADPNVKSTEPVESKPMVIQPRRLFTPEYVKEMSILINEILDEREGRMDYISYFDTEQYKHSIVEEEPKYKSAS